MPQKIPAIGEDVSHLFSGGGGVPEIGGDVSHLMGGGPRRPVSTEDFLPPEPKLEGSATGRFFSNLAEKLNPVPMIRGLAAAAQSDPSHPEDAMLGGLAPLGPIIRGAVGAQVGQAKKAAADVKAGRYVEAAGRGAAAALPLLGPAAAEAGEQGARGDIAGAIGSGIGLAAPILVGAVTPKSVRIGGVMKSPAGAADALALAERSGIPVDAATASGNKFVKAVQHVSDRSLAGSLVADAAGKTQRAGLATLGEQLAAKAAPRAVTAAEAGESAQRGVSGVVSRQRAAATDAYDRLRALEAAPENLTTIEPLPPTVNPDAPFSFTMKGTPSADDVFTEALKDARANGYTGKVGDLREKFDARVEQAKNLQAAGAEGDEYSHAALLKEIRARGGLRPFDKDYTPGAPVQKMRGEFQNAQQANQKYYGKNAVYRNDGLATDDMLQQLASDPKWGQIITPDTDLTDLIHRGAMQAPEAAGNLEHHLRGVGVQPGATWWREGAPAQHVPMAVDMASVKDAIRPIAERLAAKKGVTGALIGKEGTAAARIDALLSGPDAVPLSVADAALSDLKAMARTNHPDIRTVGQGIAARAVGDLHKAVTEAAERAGPEAVSALNEGRIATKAKYAAADVLKRLEGAQRTKSPATAFKGMTQAGDTGVGHLTDVLKQAPDTKPLIGRAVLDGLIDHPTAGPAKTFSDWQKIGAETKRLLYTPDHVRDLDAFFKLRKMLAENPNPSGTAHTLLTAGQAGLLLTEPVSGAAVQLGSAAVSTLLHSPRGVRLLTKGLRIPLGNKAASTAWLAELAAATSPSGPPAHPVGAPAR